MIKKKPIILSVGCSYTDPNFKSHLKYLPDHERGGWPIWTDHFKDKLEKYYNTKYEIIHCGRSGYGNDYALTKISQNIAKYGDRIKFVLMGGTEWHRYYDMITGMCINPLASIRQHLRPMKIESDDFLKNWPKAVHGAAISTNLAVYGQQDGREKMIMKGSEIYWNILQLCKNNNITLLVYQLLIPIASVESCFQEWQRILGKYNKDVNLRLNHKLNDFTDAKAFVLSPFAKDIFKHKKHFLGFKFLSLKNEHWDQYIKHRDLQDSLLVSPVTNILERDDLGQIKGQDMHPNAKGQEHIADQLWKHYETNFL